MNKIVNNIDENKDTPEIYEKLYEGNQKSY